MDKVCRVCEVAKPKTAYYKGDAKCKECILSAKRQIRICLACKAEWQHRGSSGGRQKLCGPCAANGKVCVYCEQYKPHDRYYGKRGKYCRDGCSAEYNRAQLYGIPIGTYGRMYAEQEGKCLACGVWHQSLCVDHDHATGAVRGLLCDGCNKGIGCFSENVEAMTGAVAYLLSYQNAGMPVATGQDAS